MEEVGEKKQSLHTLNIFVISYKFHKLIHFRNESIFQASFKTKLSQGAERLMVALRE